MTACSPGTLIELVDRLRRAQLPPLPVVAHARVGGAGSPTSTAARYLDCLAGVLGA